MFLMIANIIAFVGLFLYLQFSLRKTPPLLAHTPWEALQMSPYNLKNPSYLALFACFLFFLLLPLTIGLTFFLQSDANVVVVIAWIIWVYNWTKYTFWRE